MWRLSSASLRPVCPARLSAATAADQLYSSQLASFEPRLASLRRFSPFRCPDAASTRPASSSPLHAAARRVPQRCFSSRSAPTVTASSTDAAALASQPVASSPSAPASPAKKRGRPRKAQQQPATSETLSTRSLSAAQHSSDAPSASHEEKTDEHAASAGESAPLSDTTALPASRHGEVTTTPTSSAHSSSRFKPAEPFSRPFPGPSFPPTSELSQADDDLSSSSFPSISSRSPSAASSASASSWALSSYSTLPSHESTYVSTHYHIDPSDVYSYLRRKQLDFRANGDRTQLLVRDCPFCHPIDGKPDNQYKLTVYFPNANHYCHRCKASGSWYDMKKRLGDIKNHVVTLRDQRLQPHYTKGFPAFRKPDVSTAAADPDGAAGRRHRQPSQASMAQYHQQLEQFPEIVRWLTAGAEEGGRGLRRDLLDFYHVGAGRFKFLNDDGKYVEEECVTFPWMRVKEEKTTRKRTPKTAGDADDSKEAADDDKTADDATAVTPPPASSPSALVTPSDPAGAAAAGSAVTAAPAGPGYIIDRIKYRSRVAKHHQRLLPAGGNWGFFGLHTVPASATAVILTEGEFDAIAAYQCTGVPSISLPNGANNLPVELLPFLERFSVIYLWMDDDRVGQEGAETFAKKLGINRCWIVRTRAGQTEGPKDANDALLQGEDLCQMLADARPLPHQQITTFTDLRDDVWKEIADPQQRAGVQSTSLPTLNTLLKGHRRGELTIMTGQTGVGKTTVLSQLSLDYCAQGVTTLWGSFEIKNFKLAATMLSQYSGVELSASPALFEHYADQFEALPMYFMRFFGSSSVEQVLDAMDYAVYMYDVQHVVLDNLQFMLAGQSDKLDKFDLQDRAVNEFRHFATNKNVHITLVIHPRKEADMRPLGVSSVFGSAKATQEADNVVILQAPTPPSMYSSGTVGSDSSGWLRQKAEPQQSDFDRYRRLQVMKNRYDGEVGAIPFVYDRSTGRIQEVDKQGNVKHHAVFANVVPAPPVAAADKKKRSSKPNDDQAVLQGGVFKPAPLFTTPPEALVQQHQQRLAQAVPAATQAVRPVRVAVAEVVRNGERNRPPVRERRAGIAGNGKKVVQQQAQASTSLLQHAGGGADVGVQRRHSREGNPHRSNPPFEFIA